jgi:predicted alpha-1,2-mannosidase
MKKILLFYLVSTSFFGFAQTKKVNNLSTTTSLVQYVDTKIGANSIRSSNCVIGPQMPFGSINPSPQGTPKTKQWGNTSGYEMGTPFRGFGQLHVSGTGGSGKYGHFLVSPQIGIAIGTEEHYSPIIFENTQPHYFKAFLEKYQISTEIAPTQHSALYRFTCPKSDSFSIVLDATQSVPTDILLSKSTIYENTVEIDNTTQTIKAKIKFKGGWGGDAPYTLYFIGQYNKASIASGVWKNKELLKNVSTIARDNKEGERVGSYSLFNTKAGEQILLKVAISFKSFDNASQYLQSEIDGWNFEKVASKGLETWEAQLNKLKIETSSTDQKKIFYTALYHSMVMPRDRTGDNPKWQSTAPFWDDHFAVWDTWRTLFPLHSLINPKMVQGTVQSFIDRYKHNGIVKDAFVAGIDMNMEQGGNNIDNIIVDAFVKKIPGIDWKAAYELLQFHAEKQRIGLSSDWGKLKPESDYIKNGWIPNGWNSTSATQEFAYNDYCIAQVAKGLGLQKDCEKYLQRSNNWQNLWDSARTDKGYQGFIGIRDSSGHFIDFDVTKRYGSWKYPFYEGSSWTYSYFTPHSFDNLIALMGGKTQFAGRLDFALKNKLIDFGNEPSFLTLRAFNHACRPDLAGYWINYALNKNYDLSGVTGNDDSGAMSSWYIFSALGFFPNAGQDIYYLNAPVYPKSEITLGSGKKLTITAKNAGEKYIYIKSCKINGKPWNNPIFPHADIANGGTIEFELSDVAGDWGKE